MIVKELIQRLAGLDLDAEIILYHLKDRVVKSYDISTLPSNFNSCYDEAWEIKEMPDESGAV